MAKKSKIARNEQRKVIVARYATKRLELKKALLARGLLPFSADNRIHVVPPCIVTPDEVARALAIYDDAFAAVEASL
jgi:adenosylmethionine-8-amino-7-oxononanoate aminotransferase